ncbi:ERF family protein [Micromonospora sp. NPDC023633]|uniref:ERF family protein n=1 Tax=Micromonospora sp. NPDC023633 TaxID=3154320 RepID=UPI0033C10FA4
MAEPKTLAEALAAFQVDPPVLTKNRAGQVGNQRTKYADLVQVNSQVLARLNQLGIIYTTAPTLLDDGKFVLQYELVHVPSGDKLGGRYPLKLSENPQQMGSAITYARRYVLLALTGVAAEDEDDDGQAAAGRRYAQRAQQPRQPAGPAEDRPTAQRAQRPARPGGPPLPTDGSAGLSPAQRGMVQALFGKVGVQDRAARLNVASQLAGRKLESSNELTKAEASALIDTLDAAAKSDDPGAALAEALAAAAEAGEGR